MTWQAASFAILGLVLLGGFGWYERRRPPAKVVALVAAMAALAVVGRLAFAAVPNVKPTTDIVLFAGYALGAVPGFVVGAVTALASNVFMGHGPWTAWQMVAWGGVGAAGAALAWAVRGRELGRIALALACGAAGLAFGAFMDVYQWTLAAEQDLDSYAAIAALSLPYNLAHAIGNVVFCLLAGPLFLRALRRYRRRLEVRWEPLGASRSAARGAAACAVVALAVLAGLGAGAEPAAAAGSPSVKAVRYLLAAQNRDGGFGGAPGQASNQLFTGWSALGLAAAGRNPRDVARGRGPALTRYLRRAGSVRDTGELERTILVLRAAGLSPRSFRGRDLVKQLLRRRGRNGSWQGNVALTSFGVVALRAARAGPIAPSARWLAKAQNEDGGFGFVPAAESDVDVTGAVLQALAASRGGGGATRRAVAYLRDVHNSDGGFGQSEGRDSNAQSTSWAIQGLVASGVRPESLGASPARYLTRLQRRDGHIAYSRSSDQTPIWVTAQALTALRRKPFPLAAVPRAVGRPRRAPGQSRAVVAAGGASGRSKAESRHRRERHRGERAAGARSIRSRATRQAPPAPAPELRRARSAVPDEPEGVGWATVVASVSAALALAWLLRRRLHSRWLPDLARRRSGR